MPNSDFLCYPSQNCFVNLQISSKVVKFVVYPKGNFFPRHGRLIFSSADKPTLILLELEPTLVWF